VPDSPNFTFEDSPEGRFVETIIAAQGQLEREQNRRQVHQKMKARIQKGYWCHLPPVGYRYGKDAEHGKLLMRDEPVASVVAEALMGFASGRFQSVNEVHDFLECSPIYPRSKSGVIHRQSIHKILRNPLYAGYIEAEGWGQPLSKAKHEGLISLGEFERIQKRLRDGGHAPQRKDIHKDFPLRGFVLCDDCGTPLTAAWSKGRNKKHPYYFCRQKGCASKGKSIRRDQLEGDFEELLRALQPSRSLFTLARTMFRDAWNARLSGAAEMAKTIKKQVQSLEDQIDGLLDRVISADNPRVIKAYEADIPQVACRLT